MNHFQSTLEESVVSVVWNSAVRLWPFLSQLAPPSPGGHLLLRWQRQEPWDSHDMPSWAPPPFTRTDSETGLTAATCQPARTTPSLALPGWGGGSASRRRREWRRAPALLPGEPHAQGRLVGDSPRGHKESDATEGRTHTSYPWRALSKRNGCLSLPLLSFFLDFKVWNGLVETLSTRCLIFSRIWDCSQSLGRKAANLPRQAFKRLLSGLLFWGPSKWKNVNLGMK